MFGAVNWTCEAVLGFETVFGAMNCAREYVFGFETVFEP